MSIVIAKCTNPECGILFSAPNPIGGSEGMEVHIKDMKIGPCPECDSYGRMQDGTYKFDKNGLMSLFSAPGFTPEVLQELKKLTEKAQAQKYTPAQYKEEALKISPAVSQLFASTEFREKFWDVASSPATANFIGVLGIIIGIIGLVLAMKNKPAVVHNHYYNQDDPVKRIKGYNTNKTKAKKKRNKRR